MYPSIRVNGEQFGCGNRLSPKEAAECTVQWDLLRFSPEEFTQRARRMKAMEAVEMKECSADIDEGVSCRAGHSSFWMTWDGRMLPCGMLPHPVAKPLEIGFEAAWEQIKDATRKIRTPSKCVVCPKRDACGVCTAVCITETGAFDGVPEYMCNLTDETINATWTAYEERYGSDHED